MASKGHKCNMQYNECNTVAHISWKRVEEWTILLVRELIVDLLLVHNGLRLCVCLCECVVYMYVCTCVRVCICVCTCAHVCVESNLNLNLLRKKYN